jgi:hypothetical protein
MTVRCPDDHASGRAIVSYPRRLDGNSQRSCTLLSGPSAGRATLHCVGNFALRGVKARRTFVVARRRGERRTLTERPLAIYLRDHHAAGSAGRRLVVRAARNVTLDVEGRDELPRVAEEIEADLRRLEAIMRSEDIAPSAVKDRLAVIVEVLGRLKLNGRVRGRSRLSDVIELETLLIGITGKAALWRTLRQALPGSEDDYDSLLDRAQAQLDTVSRCRDSAALKTFAKGK